MKADYLIFIKTGDRKGAGTDANIYIALIDKEGKKSRKIFLDCKWRNDFEQGRTDKFPVSNVPDLGEIEFIELSRDTKGFGDSWFCDRVWIIPNQPGVEPTPIYFPVNRWVKADGLLKIQKWDCCLPQNDVASETRKQEILEKRMYYTLDQKSPGIPVQWDIVRTKGILLIKSKMRRLTSDTWSSLKDLGNIYKKGTSLDIPMGMYRWKEDNYFGKQRVQGVNPVLVKLCTEIPSNFKVTNEMVSPFLEGFTLDEALAKKKLFICDLTMLEDVPLMGIPVEKELVNPYALFFLNKENDLSPIAIQLFAKTTEDCPNPVFLPSDHKYVWMLAKMYYNNADSLFHQGSTHLGFTHLIMESVAVAANRTLSMSHPLYRLIAPHFLFLIAINSRALNKLVAPGGWVDQVMTAGAGGMLSITAKRFQSWRLDRDGTLPEELKMRQVDDPEVLPYYPYRDDALPIWYCIKNYVTRFVEGHYENEKAIEDDWELQEFSKALVSPYPNGCNIKGIPGDGKFQTRQQIIDTFTSFVFISSVGHAAANFAQYDEYAFPPNYPSFMRGKAPRNKDPITEADIIKHLPHKAMTLDIMVVGRILSDRGTNALGDFEIDYIFDPIGTAAVKQFREELEKISEENTKRNETRNPPYAYLNPMHIPNSISI
ncbi:uncharacterized protein TRIADDRAFT_50085 [Trichoplax adhaerens]|uniref:Lipoxygenase domain-containing protein n=1 Tax=Trichoplax adhaerens TaxID=10228 RepID=B3RT70_TRIAD|nr:hypothetical protein TRIADDRAFT_50085 [Trichoplax adhaerens]EDV27172.1 hypothetical protein TRIADDRAFT_50085 [Trichoplax adhaerens]|eukprot:XP_002111168.1 hypothetical protein TRIADDRAFT_50085 [Trichoplax adhaerens]